MPSLEVCVKPTASAPPVSESETSQHQRVTPQEPPSAKKQQQKKVNQLTLRNFFHKGNNQSKKTNAPPSPAAPAKQTVSVVIEPSTTKHLGSHVLNPKMAPSKKKQTASEPVEDVVLEEPLSEERLALLQKHADMIQRCQQRSRELVLVAREGLEEDDFEMPLPEIQVDLPLDDEFPDAVVKNMAILIEGR